MIPLVLLLSSALVDATTIWGFNNLRTSWHNTDSELQKFTLDFVSSRIVTSQYEGRIANRVAFRIEPRTRIMEAHDGSKDLEDIPITKSCLAANETRQGPSCDICAAGYCQWDVSLPCRFKLKHTRWSTALELYVTIQDGQLVDCIAVCENIGYSGEMKISRSAVLYTITILVQILAFRFLL